MLLLEIRKKWIKNNLGNIFMLILKIQPKPETMKEL
jgi:hypothetical protein